MGQVITESACRKWGARRCRMSLRDKGLGGRGKKQAGEPRRGTNQAEEPTKQRNQKKKQEV